MCEPGPVLSEEISPRVEILMQAADRRWFIIICVQQLTQVYHHKHGRHTAPGQTLCMALCQTNGPYHAVCCEK